MKTTKEELEKMANYYLSNRMNESNERWRQLIGTGDLCESSYIDGFKACEDKILAEASKDFEKFENDYFASGTIYKPTSRAAFEAGMLSQAKKDQEELKHLISINEGLAIKISELDEEIQKLKTDKEVLVKALNWYGDKKNISFMDCAHIETNEDGEEMADNGYRARQALKYIGEIKQGSEK